MTYAANEVTILIAEDDDGHAELIEDNLREAGVRNPIIRFRDGQDVLDFFYADKSEADSTAGYLLLLDIRMPRVDGVQVLRTLKGDAALKNIPVIMLTTTDDPREIELCYSLGCSCYVTKPVEYRRFAEMLHRLGLFVVIVQVPQVGGGRP